MMIKKWHDAFPIDAAQFLRIEEHPLKVRSGNIIVNDNLEAGKIEIFEYMGGPLTVQQFMYGAGKCPNAMLVADAVINDLWRDNGVFIHKISCNHGYKSLVEPIICQILHFADFYTDYQSVGISDREYKHWFPYAKEALADFHKVNRVYEYQIGSGLDG